MANREDALRDVVSKKPELLKKMMNCPEPKKLESLLNKNGIEVTETEASKIMRAINFYTVTSDVDDMKDNVKSDEVESKPRKLTDAEVETTSGGSVGAFLYWGKFLYDMYCDYQSAKKSKNEISDTMNKWKNNRF